MKKCFAVFLIMIILSLGALSVSAGTASEQTPQTGAAALTEEDGSNHNSEEPTDNSVSENNAEVSRISPSTADGEVEDDGINTNAATAWIIGISAAVALAIFSAAVWLAKKNKGDKAD